MSDILLPPGIVPQSMDLGAQYLGGLFRSDFSPAVQTISRPGGLIQGRIVYRNKANISSAPHRDLLTSAVMDMRGVESRLLIRDYSNVLRGSFPATEVFNANTTFESGITNWTGGASVTLTQDGYFMRLSNRHRSAQVIDASPASHTIVANVPYAVRCFYRQPAVSGLRVRLAVGKDTASGEELVNVTMIESGLYTRSFVEDDTAVFPHLETGPQAGRDPFDHALIGLYSVARCILVDNRGNQITRSEEFDHADWTKARTTISADADVSPAANTTADRLIEDSSVNQTHFVGQAATKGSLVESWCFSVYVKPNSRSELRLIVGDAVSPTDFGWAFFNITGGSEAIGTVGVNGTFTNARAFLEVLGDNWNRVSVVAETDSSSGIAGRIDLAIATEDVSYTGDGASNMRIWGAQLTRSSVPAHYQQSVASVATADTQSGSEIRVKGLPISTSGLLLPGDRVDLNIADTSGNDKDDLQFLICTAGLDSDGLGLGILHVEPGLRAAPDDNAPIVVLNPMIRAVPMVQNPQWTHRRPGFSDFEIPFLEAAS